jgi:hypothetical protein
MKSRCDQLNDIFLMTYSLCPRCPLWLNKERRVMETLQLTIFYQLLTIFSALIRVNLRSSAVN